MDNSKENERRGIIDYFQIHFIEDLRIEQVVGHRNR